MLTAIMDPWNLARKKKPLKKNPKPKRKKPKNGKQKALTQKWCNCVLCRKKIKNCFLDIWFLGLIFEIRCETGLGYVSIRREKAIKGGKRLGLSWKGGIESWCYVFLAFLCFQMKIVIIRISRLVMMVFFSCVKFFLSLNVV